MATSYELASQIRPCSTADVYCVKGSDSTPQSAVGTVINPMIC